MYMLNAIRIGLGVLMSLIALGGLWFSFLFTGFKFWVYFTDLSALFDFIVIVIAPSVAGVLLLAPKNQRYAFAGLGLAIIYIGYVLVDQIL